MHPVLFEIDSWRIRSYDLVLVLSILTGFFVFIKEGKRKGFASKKLWVYVIGMLVFALLGARINGWLFWFRSDPGLLDLNILNMRKGMTAFGGILGAVIFTLAYCFIHHWKTWRILDIMGPVLVLCEGIQRIGCLLNGCCFGKLTHSHFGMYLPDITGVWSNRFPTQILTSLFCFGLFAYLWRNRKFVLKDGDIFLTYLILYSSGRLLLDFLRGDETKLVGIFTSHQVAALLMAMIGAGLIFFTLPKGGEGQKTND